MRLSDADALGIGKAKREVFNDPAYADGWNSAIEIIENAPTIDAVEVVRCKDCKHRRIGEFGARRCAVWQTYNGFGDDGFCHYGERREYDDARSES